MICNIKQLGFFAHIEKIFEIGNFFSLFGNYGSEHSPPPFFWVSRYSPEYNFNTVCLPFPWLLDKVLVHWKMQLV